MKISGSDVIDQPLDKVWDALLDPRVLVATIPGCERLVPTGEHAYEEAAEMTGGVVELRADGMLLVLPSEEPHSARATRPSCRRCAAPPTS